MIRTPSIVSLALLSLSLLSCSKKTTVSIVESMEVTVLEKWTEVTEYEATLEPLGKTPEGDSLGWSLRRITPDGKGASPMEEAVMLAKRNMSIGMVMLPNRCLKFGDGIPNLRSALAAEAIEEIDGKDSEKEFATQLIGNYLAMDPMVSSLMATAPADLLMLSGLAPGRHDSLLMPHPYYAAIQLQYSLDLASVDGALEGSVVLDSGCLAGMPESVQEKIGHVGRFIRRNTDPAKLELTVVDTFIIPETPLSREEKRILKRIYRADLPLVP
jgi:hypothetical protein